jgi:hypothetical protein
LVWDELIIHGGGEILEAGELLALHLRSLLGEDFWLVWFLVLQQMPENPRQLVGHGGDVFGRAQPGFPPYVGSALR